MSLCLLELHSQQLLVSQALRDTAVLQSLGMPRKLNVISGTQVSPPMERDVTGHDLKHRLTC